MVSLSVNKMVVIGVSRGIGRRFVEAGIRNGAHVLAVARQKGPLEQLAMEIPGVEILALDATDENAPSKVFDVLTPDILILGGGVFPPAAPIHEQSWQQFPRTGRTTSELHSTSARLRFRVLSLQALRWCSFQAVPLWRARRSPVAMPEPSAPRSSLPTTARKSQIASASDCASWQLRRASFPTQISGDMPSPVTLATLGSPRMISFEGWPHRQLHASLQLRSSSWFSVPIALWATCSSYPGRALKPFQHNNSLENDRQRSYITRNGSARSITFRASPRANNSGLRAARRTVPPGNQIALLPHAGLPARSRRRRAGNLAACLAQFLELRGRQLR